MLIQRCINVVQRCFDVASTFDTDVVSTLCNVENPTSDFASFSTSDRRYFNVDPQRWSNVDPTSKCCLGYIFWIISVRHISDQKFDMILFISFVLFIDSGLTNYAVGKLVLHGFYKPHTIKASLKNLIFVLILTIEQRLRR